MVFRLISFLLFIESLFVSCSTKVKDTNNYGQSSLDSVELIRSDSLVFMMDSNTVNKSDVYQIFTYNEKEFLAFLNGSEIKIFDIDKKKQHLDIHIDENAEGIERIMGFKIINLDSIILTSRYQLFIVDSTGKKIYSHNFINSAQECGLYRFGVNFGTSEIIVDGFKVYFLGIPLAHATDYELHKSLKQVIICLDLKKDKVKGFAKYPYELMENVYPSLLWVKPYMEINPDKKFILSFGASHNLYVYDLKDNTEVYEVKSKKYDHIPPTTLSIVNDRRKSELHYRTTPGYGQILYDKYRKVYYRIIKKPVTIEQFNNRIWAKTPYVMILDQNLRVIGETDLSRDLSSMHILVCSKGLLIQNKNTIDDVLQFEIFKIK